MRLKSFCASLYAASLVLSGAWAGEMADACVAALEAEGRDTSGCSCLEDAIGGDEALIDEFTQLGEIADAGERYDSASDEAKAIMGQCTR